MKTKIQLVYDYFDAFVNKNLNLLSEMFDNNIRLIDWEISAHGKAEVLKANQSIFDSVESIKIDIIKIAMVDSIFMAQVSIKINKDIDLKVIDVITFNSENKIIEVSAYKQ